jgi:uncharacterized metal-binding protein
VTIILAVPTLLVAWGVTGRLGLAVVATCATLFGGFMFGPDLDIQSRQYTRWGPLRFLWLPYRALFRHRSRLSHGIVFGTLIRVIYFTGVLALIAFCAVLVYGAYVNGGAPDLGRLAQSGRGFEAGVRRAVGDYTVWAVLAGLWWGAAVHTLTDVLWSMIRKGSEIF